jgi:hypothetical protein
MNGSGIVPIIGVSAADGVTGHKTKWPIWCAITPANPASFAAFKISLVFTSMNPPGSVVSYVRVWTGNQLDRQRSA